MDAPHTNHAMLMPFQDLQYLQKSLITVDSMCHQLEHTEDPPDGSAAAIPKEDPPIFGGARSLDTSGSHFFHPLGCWTSKAKNKSRRGGANAETLKSALAPAEPERFQFILNPTGHFRNLWDFIGICLLILDTMILPVQFVNANFYSLYPSLAVNSRIGAFYWASDIVLSFRTGYIKKLVPNT